MNIQDAVNQKQVPMVGPVEITGDKGLNPKTSTPLRTMTITDPSRPTGIKLKIWGPAASSQVQVGQTINIRAQQSGSVKYDEYQNVPELNANACIIEVVAANTTPSVPPVEHAGPPTGQDAQPPAGNMAQPPPTQQPTIRTMHDLIDYGLGAVAYARSKGESDSAILASVFGSSMHGLKEGRPLS